MPAPRQSAQQGLTLHQQQRGADHASQRRQRDAGQAKYEG